MFLERSPNSALRKVLGFSFRGISWEEDPGKFSWVVSSQENPVSGRGFKSRIKPVRGRPRDCRKTAVCSKYKARRGSNCKEGAARSRETVQGRRDGKHVHWECDVEVGVGKADVHWPHACLGTESG